jgi:hypothetical protein
VITEGAGDLLAQVVYPLGPHPGGSTEKRSGQAKGTDELQRQLRDLLCLAVVGDHVLWVLTDDETAELAQWLGEA